MTTNPPAHSWRRGLQRGSVGGGFFSDPAWYDANLEKRMPLFPEMMRRMVHALPPMAEGARVLDFLGGSGSASAAVAAAYPHTSVTVLDASAARLQRATQRFQRAGLPQPATLHQTVSANVSCVASGGFSLIVASLALHHLLEHDAQCDRPAAFSRWSTMLLRSLAPGVGHLFVCDHTGQLPLFTQMQLLQQAGFVDVDAAWRVDDMFVIGCRRPADNEANEAGDVRPPTSTNQVAGPASHVQPATASSNPAPSSSTAAAPVPLVAAVPAPAFAVSAPAASCGIAAAPSSAASVPSSAVPPSHVQRSSLTDDDEVNRMIAALQAQNEELKARLNAAPVAAAAETTNSTTSGAPAPAASSSSSPSPPSPALLSKLPLLFNRFDPARSGQLSYAALQSLCRAVGRDPDSETDGSESLWWTYQSLALPDPESGQIGLSIEDLSEHFYRSGMWSLEHDLRKLNLHA